MKMIVAFLYFFTIFYIFLAFSILFSAFSVFFHHFLYFFSIFHEFSANIPNQTKQNVSNDGEHTQNDSTNKDVAVSIEHQHYLIVSFLALNRYTHCHSSWSCLFIRHFFEFFFQIHQFFFSRI